MSSVLIKFIIQWSKTDVHAFNNVGQNIVDFAMSKQWFQEKSQGDEFHVQRIKSGFLKEGVLELGCLKLFVLIGRENDNVLAIVFHLENVDSSICLVYQM